MGGANGEKPWLNLLSPSTLGMGVRRLWMTRGVVRHYVGPGRMIRLATIRRLHGTDQNLGRLGGTETLLECLWRPG